MTKAKIESITIVGRRWFQKTYGNTYHSVDIYVNGERVHRIDFAYGYDSMYMQNARDWLHTEGLIEFDHLTEPLWSAARRLGIKLVDSVTDVSRKKDL